ncbi:hypothetical protein [Nereida ignava]|uniref:hypothetical protein n=1 Tax=Nereida ignava TaxID=282199 RepID=UPI0030F93FDE
MTDNNQPITPSPELVEQWCYEDGDEIRTSPRWYQRVCAKAARWGYEQRGADIEDDLQKARDEELEACCEVLARELICDGKHVATDLRAARRPKPPSLKEQAFEALKHAEEGWRPVPADCEIIRRALESLPD